MKNINDPVPLNEFDLFILIQDNLQNIEDKDVNQLVNQLNSDSRIRNESVTIFLAHEIVWVAFIRPHKVKTMALVVKQLIGKLDECFICSICKMAITISHFYFLRILYDEKLIDIKKHEKMLNRKVINSKYSKINGYRERYLSYQEYQKYRLGEKLLDESKTFDNFGVLPNTVQWALKNDNVELLKDLSKIKHFNFSTLRLSTIFPQPYETFLTKAPSLISYAAYCGSEKCFDYLCTVKNINLDDEVAINAARGGSLSILKKCNIKQGISTIIAVESIKFRHYHIFEYIYDIFKQRWASIMAHLNFRDLRAIIFEILNKRSRDYGAFIYSVTCANQPGLLQDLVIKLYTKYTSYSINYPLTGAMEYGNTSAAKLLLAEKKVDFASECNIFKNIDETGIKVLIAAGFTFTTKDIESCIANNLDLAEEFTNNNISFNGVKITQQNLELLAMDYNLKTLTKLEKAGLKYDLSKLKLHSYKDLSLENLQYFLSKGLPLGQFEKPPFTESMEYRDSQSIKILLDYMNIDNKSELRQALVALIKCRQKEHFQRLCNRAKPIGILVQPNCKDEDPLLAAMKDHLTDYVKILIECGCNPINSSAAIFKQAFEDKNIDIVKEGISHGLDKSIVNNQTEKYLTKAMKQGLIGFFEDLLKLGFTLEAEGTVSEIYTLAVEEDGNDWFDIIKANFSTMKITSVEAGKLFHSSVEKLKGKFAAFLLKNYRFDKHENITELIDGVTDYFKDITDFKGLTVSVFNNAEFAEHFLSNDGDVDDDAIQTAFHTNNIEIVDIIYRHKGVPKDAVYVTTEKMLDHIKGRGFKICPLSPSIDPIKYFANSPNKEKVLQNYKEIGVDFSHGYEVESLLISLLNHPQDGRVLRKLIELRGDEVVACDHARARASPIDELISKGDLAPIAKLVDLGLKLGRKRSVALLNKAIFNEDQKLFGLIAKGSLEGWKCEEIDSLIVEDRTDILRMALETGATPSKLPVTVFKSAAAIKLLTEFKIPFSYELLGQQKTPRAIKDAMVAALNEDFMSKFPNFPNIERYKQFLGPGINELLLDQCAKGDTENISKLLKLGASIKYTSTTRGPPLLEAIKNNQPGAIMALITKGANPNERINGELPLQIAIDCGDKNTVSELIIRGASVKIGKLNLDGKDEMLKLLISFAKEFKKGVTVDDMLNAIANGKMNILNACVNAGLSVDLVQKKETPLIVAVESEEFGPFDYLIKHGANVNLQNEDGDTALIIAARKAFQSAVRSLLSVNADVGVLNNNGHDAVWEAIAVGSVPILEMLLESGAKFNSKATPGSRSMKEYIDGRRSKVAELFEACTSGEPVKVEAIIRSGVDINAKNSYGNTPLIEAAKNGNINCIKIIVKNKAEIDAKNDQNSTALIEACNSGYIGAARVLVEAGANVNAVNNGFSCLQAASSSGCDELVRFLIANGAEIGARRYRIGSPEVANTLISMNAKIDTEFVASHGRNFVKNYLLELLAKRIKENNVEEMKRLISIGVPVTLVNDSFDPLESAVSKGSAEICRLLVDAGASVTREIVLEAVNTGNASIVSALHLSKELANITDASGTPLINVAFRSDNVEMVKALLDAGAHPSGQYSTKSKEMANALRNAGADVEIVRPVEPKATLPDDSVQAKKYQPFSNQPQQYQQPRQTPQKGRASSKFADYVPAAPQLAPQVAPPATLREAAARGDYAAAKRMIESGAAIEADPYVFGSPEVEALMKPYIAGELFKAAYNNNPGDIEKIVHGGINVNIADQNGTTALHIAARAGNAAAVDMLVSNGANPNMPDNAGNIPCADAALVGSEECVLRMLQVGYDPNYRRQNGNTILMDAAQSGNASLFSLLLQCNLTQGIESIQTPNQSIAIMAQQYLASAGIAPQVPPKTHKRRKSRRADPSALIQQQQPQSAAPLQQQYPGMIHSLIAAAREGSVRKLNSALRKAPDQITINAALAEAVAANNDRIVDALLQAGASPNAAMGDGTPLIHAAASVGANRALQSLIRMGADMTAVYQGLTPIQAAGAAGNVEGVSIFMGYGVSPAGIQTSSYGTKIPIAPSVMQYLSQIQ